MGQALSNTFPPKPTLTEKNLADQSGKVFIVTGGSSGIGKELASILYERNAKVYVATRSEAKARSAIEEIQDKHPDSKGEIRFLHLDLSDLSTIKKSAEEFLAQEQRLDVLWNNAGVMVPPPDIKTAQGYEMQLGTNVLGPFLFTHHLLPILKETAKTVAVQDSVRVVWVASGAVVVPPKPPIDFSNMDYKKKESSYMKYCRSKVGNVLHSVELSRRIAGQGVISLSIDPGNFTTNLQRNFPRWVYHFMRVTILYPPILGACTEIYAGLQTDITEKNNGGWIAPFGRIAPGRKDLWDPELGRKYWEWTEEQVKPYL